MYRIVLAAQLADVISEAVFNIASRWKPRSSKILILFWLAGR